MIVVFHTASHLDSRAPSRLSFIILQRAGLTTTSNRGRINKSLKKKALLQGMRMFGRHPRIRLAMVCESKGWEECHNFIKAKRLCLNVSEPLLDQLSMEDDKNSIY